MGARMDARRVSSRLRQHLTMPVHAVGRHRQRVRFRREWPALARHAELPFDLLIVRPQIVVTDRPIRPHSFRGECAEIVAMESRRHAKPWQRAAADACSGFRNHEVRADEVARLGPHDLACVRLRVLQSRDAAKPRPSFQQCDRQSVRRHPQRHQAPVAPAPTMSASKRGVRLRENESLGIRTRYQDAESWTRTISVDFGRTADKRTAGSCALNGGWHMHRSRGCNATRLYSVYFGQALFCQWIGWARSRWRTLQDQSHPYP